MLSPTFANRRKSTQKSAETHGNCIRVPVITDRKLTRIPGCGRHPNSVDLARLPSVSMGLNRSINWIAFETLVDHIALFNECVRLHLYNELAK